MGVVSLFRYVCSLVMPDGLVGLGGLVSPSISINMCWDPIQRLKCACLCVHRCRSVHVFMTPLQPDELQAIAGQQGCHGDQWCQSRATSVGCLSRQAFPFSVFVFSLPPSVQLSKTEY